MPSLASDREADLDLEQWTLFLQDYAKGLERPPPPLLRSASSAPANDKSSSLPSFEVPLYPPGEISPAIARTIAEFYAEHGFLPPPRADEETIRLQTIQEYNLFREDQAENFHRCSSLVNTFFQFAPICTISLFHNDVQVVVSKAGEFPVQLGEGLVTETSICGHAVLKKNGEITELNQLDGDWRFQRNPWCAVDTNGVKGYVGVPITLEVDPSNPHDSERVTVGVLALMSNRPFLKLTDTQTKVLDDLSTMLSVQLRSTWEGWRRGKETRLRNAVSQFLEKALVEPSQQAMVDAEAAMAEPPVQGSGSGRNTPRGVEAMSLTPSLLANAAEQLQDLLEADFAILIDLSSFHATKMDGRRQRSHSWVADGQARAQSTKRILGSSSTAIYKDYENNFDTPQAMAAIASFLDMYFVTGRSVYSGSGGSSGLESLLALSSTESSPPAERGSKAFQTSATVSHIALPFYSANRPNMLIVVASAAPLFSFKPADVTFVSNVGAVVIAHLTQTLIVEADAAKTAFVSQISHELRTPLHGLLGQLHLLRDCFSSGELAMVPSLLDSAEYCGTALQGIVDDVLDFGKMAQASRDGGDTTPRSRNVLVDLAQITLESSKSCWLRRLQWQSITGSELDSQSGAPPSPSVELTVEYEDRSDLKDWWISMDVSGFMRVLNNLVTNSLKYTAEGMIIVSLISGRGTETDQNGKKTSQVTLRVEDTGRGIAPEFMDKLFEPFTQADSFSPGAGLGLNICKSVVDRMQGTITVEARPGGGSIFTVVLPVDDVELAPPDTPPKMRRTVISKSEPEPEPPPSPSPPEVPAEKSSPPAQPIPPPPVPPKTPSESKAEEDEQHLDILVVDDNTISRKILVAMLKRLNATAHQAHDGLNALEVFREVHPHVVWTDISMPRMDGVTSAKEMRKIERELGWSPSHIVAITGLGLTDEQIRREALLGPAALDGWLIKGQTNLNSLKESLAAVRRKLKQSISAPDCPPESSPS
ncbi:hypothetical protein C8R44DRAFT_120168 [Mycena epipterygia]|nr:hypothetical protein C8R44DRAFT_120168 [Mycena epipterygia]